MDALSCGVQAAEEHGQPAVAWLLTLAMAVTGSVWFVGQVCALSPAALALVIAVRASRGAAVLPGGPLGLAALGRPTSCVVVDALGTAWWLW